MVRYMPQLVEAGKIYKALPPLYANTKDGKSFQYYSDGIDFIRFVQKNFMKTNKISLNGNDLTGKDITVLFMVNEDYIFNLETMAGTYRVEPQLLEFALISYINGSSINTINKNLKHMYRFMSATDDKKLGNVIYDGTIKDSNFLVCGDRVVNECKTLIDTLKKNVSCEYILNGKPATIYEIMTAYEKSKPSGIRRYKGLGEMKSFQLAESTMRPGSNRTLIRYTFQDMKEEIEAIREFESDRSKLLNFIGTVKRADLLE